MKYIIMADGKGTRWDNYLDIPKHFYKINGETLLGRCVRLLHQYDKEAQVIITSHDSRYEIPGASRYEPKNNVLEIDRFTRELIEDNVCFLYGDTYYTEETMQLIVETSVKEILFFGTEKSIVAIKVKDGKMFKQHVEHVRQLYVNGEIKKCIGWQVYQSYCNLPFEGKVIDRAFVKVTSGTCDFNTPEDTMNLKIQ